MVRSNFLIGAQQAKIINHCARPDEWVEAESHVGRQDNRAIEIDPGKFGARMVSYNKVEVIVSGNCSARLRNAGGIFEADTLWQLHDSLVAEAVEDPKTQIMMRRPEITEISAPIHQDNRALFDKRVAMIGVIADIKKRQAGMWKMPSQKGEFAEQDCMVADIGIARRV
jgi:hypothetical protein